MPPSTYHQQLAREKRSAIVDAATRLFLASGYSRASLAKIADEAGVSKATLFKQFPTKAALFDAIVDEYWRIEGEQWDPPRPGDLRAGLTAVGRRYVALLTRPGMADLFRIVIAEAPRFPELGRTQFRLGKMPFFALVRDYLTAEVGDLPDPDLAATQFLGMIADFVLWPRMLLTDWSPGADATAHAVDEAVTTMVARHGSAAKVTDAPRGHDSGHGDDVVGGRRESAQ